MSSLAPLPTAVPLAAAAFIMAFSRLLTRRACDLIAVFVCASVVVICAEMMSAVARSPIVYWFGGWDPRAGVAVGICFFVDRFSAGLAGFVALLATAVFVFSWHYFDSVGVLFHTLILVFVGAMAGFCLSGDIFTTFVFFELMSITAYSLTAYKREKSELAGSINFAVTNSIAAFLMLIGITLLYGRTGALNLAQIGRALAGGPADMLVLVSFVLIMSGFFTKAALVPFHFWLADAHAVAPTPVSVLFSGVMVELGLYGAARVYWTVFDGALMPHRAAVSSIFVGAGTLTALVGGVMCFMNRSLKRLLAFSTVSHLGVLMIGIGLLAPPATAGAAIYLIGHGFVKGALFICTGILLYNFYTVDELELHGRGGRLRLTGIVFTLGGLALAGLPATGMHLGKELIDSALGAAGRSWVMVALFLSSVLTGGAVLRCAGHIFLGWGTPGGVESSGPKMAEGQEIKGRSRAARFVMFVPAAALLCGAFTIAAMPHLEGRAEGAASYFQDRERYAMAVMEGEKRETPSGERERRASLAVSLLGLSSAPAAVLLALVAIFGKPARRFSRRKALRFPGSCASRLRALHSGLVCDYVAWLLAGVTALGVLVVLLIYRHAL